MHQVIIALRENRLQPNLGNNFGEYLIRKSMNYLMKKTGIKHSFFN